MTLSPRDLMIRTAARLFRREGYRATSWRKLIEASGAPWGSAHHYFPNGKAQLGQAAIEASGQDVAKLIAAAFAGRPAIEGVRRLFAASGAMLEASGFRDGCPVTTVALETSPDVPALAEACRAAFGLWRATMSEQLEAAGFNRDRAEALAPAILALFEGALVMARVECSLDPMQTAAEASAFLVSYGR